MIPNDLVVEYLLILQLLQGPLDLVGNLNVARSLGLFGLRAGIPQLVQDRLIVGALRLDLLVEGIYLGAHVGRLVIGEVDGPEHIRRMIVIVYSRISLMFLYCLPKGPASSPADPTLYQ